MISLGFEHSVQSNMHAKSRTMPVAEAIKVALPWMYWVLRPGKS